MKTIKEIRAACDMTQKDFAEKLGIPKRTIEEWEYGRRKPPKYIAPLIQFRMAEYFKK